MVQKGVKIAAPAGKLGVLIPGLGAVSTTFIAGVEAVKKQIAKPKGTNRQQQLFNDAVRKLVCSQDKQTSRSAWRDKNESL